MFGEDIDLDFIDCNDVFMYVVGYYYCTICGVRCLMVCGYVEYSDGFCELVCIGLGWIDVFFFVS